MSKIEIRLEAGSLDLLPDAETDFFVTKEIHDLRDLETRKGGSSKTMTIPRTQNNANILGVELVEFGRDTTEDYKFLDCEVFMSSYPVVEDAKLIVLSEEDTSKTISIQIFGGVVDFFSQISGESIRKLPWSEFSFEWNLTSIQDFVNTDEGLLFANNTWFDNESWNQALANDISPQIELNDPDIRFNGAWMYVKTIVNKILASMPNLRFNFETLEAIDLYDKMVLAIPTTQLFDNFSLVETSQGFVEEDDGLQDLPGGLNPPITAVFPIIKEDIPTGFWNPATNTYDITASGFYDITLNQILSCFGNTTIFGFGSVSVSVSGEIIFQQQINNVNETVDFETSRFLNAGESVGVFFNGQLSVNTTGWFWSGSFKTSGSGNSSSDFVDISQWIPDISQRAFMQEIFKPFHALPTFADGVTQINLWDEIPEAEQFDITPFADNTKEINKQGFIPGYGQVNVFEYTVDNGVTRLGTDFTFDMANELLPERVVKIKSIFSPSDQSFPTDYLKISTPLLPFFFSKSSGNPISVTAGSAAYTTEEQNTFKIGDLIFVRNANDDGFQGRRRVVATSGNSGVVDVDFVQDSNFDYEQFSYSKATIINRIGYAFQEGETLIRDGGLSVTVPAMKGVAFTDSFNWSQLAELFYPSLIAMLEKPVVKTVWFRFPTTVFNALTPLIPVYFKDRAYYMNIIEQYNFSRFCRVELVEIKQNLLVAPQAFYAVIPNPVDWLNVDQSTVTQEKVDVTNTGDVPIDFDVTAITGTDAAFFTFNPAVPPFTLGANEVKEIFIDFTADTSFGSRTAEFDVRALNPDVFDVTVVLNAFIDSPANYLVAPNPLNFGAVQEGHQLDSSTRINNVGTESIDFTLSAFSGPDASEFDYHPGQLLAFTILPGGFEDIIVRWDSDLPAGPKQAFFTIEANVPDIFDTVVEVNGNTTI